MTVIFPLPKFSPFLEHFSVLRTRVKIPLGEGSYSDPNVDGLCRCGGFCNFFSWRIDSREARAAVIANETKKRKTHTYFEFLTPGEYIGSEEARHNVESRAN